MTGETRRREPARIRVLLALNDLYLRGGLEPSEMKRLTAEFEQWVAPALRRLVEEHLRWMVETYFMFRVCSPCEAEETRELDFLVDIADAIFQLVRFEGDNEVREAAARLAAKCGNDRLAAFVALDVYAKRRAVDQGLLSQTGQLLHLVQPAERQAA